MAYTYCVSFRIANRTVGSSTYEDRRARLIDNLREENLDFWDGTTSFFFVESNRNTYDFASNAVRGLSEEYDMVVIFDPSDMSAAYFGAVPNVGILESFLPLAKKLP